MGIIFKNGVPYSGGGDNSKVINYEDFLKLSEEEKNNGTSYYIPDHPGSNPSPGSGDTVEVVDNLESTDTEAALSANMGRQLKEDIDNINLIKASDGTLLDANDAKIGHIYYIDGNTTNGINYPAYLETVGTYNGYKFQIAKALEFNMVKTRIYNRSTSTWSDWDGLVKNSDVVKCVGVTWTGSTTAGTSIKLATLSEILPEGAVYCGALVRLWGGAASMEYNNNIGLNPNKTDIHALPTKTQTSVTITFSVFYK